MPLEAADQPFTRSPAQLDPFNNNINNNIIESVKSFDHRWYQIPTMSIGTQIPALPEHSGVSYLAEGAANVVFRLSIRYPTPDPTVLEEYGDGTPPPAVIDVRDDEGNCQRVTLNVFDGMLIFIGETRFKSHSFHLPS